MKLLVYSHDAYGLGNIRRMLAICESLLSETENLSILLISGSPMLHGFRLPKGLDYIKLPCLNRGQTGNVTVKYLGCDVNETVKLRSDLILSAVANYQPDLFLIDKKPYGLKNELTATLDYLQTTRSQTKLVLLLRDILDSPETTIADWQKNGYYDAIEEFYDFVLVVGTPTVFDAVKEYQFPAGVAQKVRYCGYIRRSPGLANRTWIRQSLQMLPQEKLVLVTPGGGEDGYHLVKTYLSGLDLMPAEYNVKSLVICGPEMPEDEKKELYQVAQNYPQVQIKEFTDDLISYVGAADAIVSMSGYNTICEILSLKKSAVIVPRIKPSREQLIRAERMDRLGLVKNIHPDNLNPQVLMEAVLNQLNQKQIAPTFDLDMNALRRISYYISILLFQRQKEASLQKLLVVGC
ncbi:glycosyltransferase [Scytonema sp. UIC 10036]|uniref:glycosyltransferase family protein n=1 Tax=Scytonema sp. UIC 10036 TaxID=2304196 RepID=UPI0012DA5377|nr:glycosyltransferase [Scytonema sp. UIC 10036]MUG96380.1 glycosyltransferase [Scytonema sp. UIC 10036]